MQVYKSKIQVSIEPNPFHLIEKKGWEMSHIPGKQQFWVHTFCGMKAIVNGDIYETLNRKKHEKKTCSLCITAFKKKLAG